MCAMNGLEHLHVRAKCDIKIIVTIYKYETHEKQNKHKTKVLSPRSMPYEICAICARVCLLTVNNDCVK